MYKGGKTDKYMGFCDFTTVPDERFVLPVIIVILAYEPPRPDPGISLR